MDTDLPPPNPPANNPPPIPPPLLSRPPYAQPPRKRNGWKILSLVLIVVLVVVLGSSMLDIFHGLVAGPVGQSHLGGPKLEEQILEHHDSDHKIAVIPVEGIITSDGLDRGGYSMIDLIEDQLEMAARDKKVKAVLLKVNSPGGEVLASDDINRAITDFQTRSGKPVVASMGSLAASGGYYVSVPCRWIVANELTITGSIGVIMHALNYRGLMDKVGLRSEVFKSGKFKDMLSGTKKEEEITTEERMMVQKLVDETFARFKQVVAEGRQQANSKNEDSKASKGRTLSSRWEDFADGRVLSGKEAFELGFVEEQGNFETAVSRARDLAGIKDANLVQYHQIFDLSSLLHLFGKTETPALKVDLGLDAPKLKAGQLYFLSPTFVH